MNRKRQVANLVQRAPWSIQLMQVVWRRLLQPWITVGALGAVFNDTGQLLIVEHVFHPIFPWGLPGGWMNRNEDPDETIRRELFEETGLRVITEKPLLITQAPTLPNHLDIAFLCRALPGEVTLSSELLAYRWIDPTDAPPLMNFHRRVVAAALAERAKSTLLPEDVSPEDVIL